MMESILILVNFFAYMLVGILMLTMAVVAIISGVYYLGTTMGNFIKERIERHEKNR